mmetsp:Transcript_22062/g.37356  ORF Transcript_22062/g.37356 Transcript_22062/m.37356 type:complete len:246 (+) Transcript_22062:19-756(+)
MEFLKKAKRPRILCLHGMRTSGLILSRQMASLKYHVQADFVYVDAPFPASGPPQDVVAQFYPNLPYFEWLSGVPEEGLNWLLEYLSNKENGSFDGILGFSQGARMAARVVMSLSNSCTDFIATPLQQEIISLQHNLKFFIFVGGVSAMHHLPTDFTPLGVPTLHIMGANDPFIEQSRKLTTFFDSHTSTLLNHGEGHNIPSLRTGLYPEIDAWLQSQMSSSQSAQSQIEAEVTMNTPTRITEISS